MVKLLPSMVDMAMTPKEQEEVANPSPPTYPYGLCISLCQDELDKLQLDVADISVGDMIHLFCMAKVTSISSSDNEHSGPNCRVELQITNIAAEDEDEENVEADRTPAEKIKKLYK